MKKTRMILTLFILCFVIIIGTSCDSEKITTLNMVDNSHYRYSSNDVDYEFEVGFIKDNKEVHDFYLKITVINRNPKAQYLTAYDYHLIRESNGAEYSCTNTGGFWAETECDKSSTYYIKAYDLPADMLKNKYYLTFKIHNEKFRINLYLE